MQAATPGTDGHDGEYGRARSRFNDSRAVALAIIPNSEEISFEEF